MKSILALDQGTTSSRAIVFGHDGSVRAVAQQEFRQIFPQAGWVEHDANQIWQTQLETARAALTKAGLTATEIAAIGITNQRETTVLWDRKTSEPIHNAIVWQDRRTSKFCDELKAAGHAELIQQRAGLVIDAYFSGSKVRWLLDNVPGARERAERGELAFGTIDSWLVWKLTNGARHIIDPSNASRTMLCNLRGEWDDDLLKVLGVPRGVLPEVRSSSEVYGETTLFGAPVKIAGIAGDQQAALFGQNCFERGLAKNTYGTGCFRLTTRSKAAFSSAGRRCNGCATGWASSRPPSMWRNSPRACPTAGAFIWCRRSPVWVLRTGTNTRGASLQGSRAAPPRRTSRGPRWKASPFRSLTCSR